MMTVQQLHNSIQHDLEYIEQVIRNNGVCVWSVERGATIDLHQSVSTYCYVQCAMVSSDCPMCEHPATRFNGASASAAATDTTIYVVRSSQFAVEKICVNLYKKLLC